VCEQFDAAGRYAGSPDLSGDASAQSALQAQLTADQSSVEALPGQWVPHLSSKSYGLGANDCYAKLISHTAGPTGSSANPRDLDIC
jgi:hypothetical protein